MLIKGDYNLRYINCNNRVLLLLSDNNRFRVTVRNGK